MARRGTDNITVRMDGDLWRSFGAATDDRSEVLRAFVRWYVREKDARLPKRPDSIDRTDPGDRGDDPSRSTP